MPRTRWRTARKVAGRTRGVGPVVVDSTLVRTPDRPQVEGTRLCPACGRYIKMRKDSTVLYAHKKHRKSNYNCPGF